MNDSGPAFPSDEVIVSAGLTLRDYFAARAMQRMISNPKFVSDKGAFSISNIKAAWEIADTMLKERKKDTQS